MNGSTNFKKEIIKKAIDNNNILSDGFGNFCNWKLAKSKTQLFKETSNSNNEENYRKFNDALQECITDGLVEIIKVSKLSIIKATPLAYIYIHYNISIVENITKIKESSIAKYKKIIGSYSDL